MRCSVCEKEMEKGFVQTGQRIAWVTHPHKLSLQPKNGEVLLGNNVFSGLTFDAYICKDCKTILIDYSGSEYQEG